MCVKRGEKVTGSDLPEKDAAVERAAGYELSVRGASDAGKLRR